MMLLTASGPSLPWLRIILVVAILSESLKRVMMRMSVGKVVRSVGLGTYSEISRIKTATAIEIVSRKSKTPEGRGTMIIARIAITNATTLKSL